MSDAAARAAAFHGSIRAVLDAVNGAVLGQEPAVDLLVAGYASGGHVLLEGMPGVGKTLLARCLASALGVGFRRIQFTPDLMPADVVGANVLDPRRGEFHLVRGPLFTEFLMADEINRTPPKTQSALLEAMQERQATIDGTSHPLPPGMFVVATQNPVEFEGVYPLPEAQLDRFHLRVRVGVPSPEAEDEVLRRAVAGRLVGWGEAVPLPTPVVERHTALELRSASSAVHVEDDIIGYVGRLRSKTRSSARVQIGPSPRAGLALLEVARGVALTDERDFVTPDDVKRALVPCWSHRILLEAEAELEGESADRLLDRLAGEVEVPR